MIINKTLSPVPFYANKKYWHSNKWYVYGQKCPIPMLANQTLPFQVNINSTSLSLSQFNIRRVEDNSVARAVNVEGNYNLILQDSYSIVQIKSCAIEDLPLGLYYYELVLSDGTSLISDIISIIDNISNYLRIVYKNNENLYFSNGHIDFSNDFAFELFVRSTIGKPEYEYEEELTKRLGYKFVESQISNKVYKFTFPATEALCDAYRLVRICDYIRIESFNADFSEFQHFNVLYFTSSVDWEDNGDIATVETSFETDSIVQKLQDYSRTQIVNFYNALLSNSDEALKFDDATIAQYYNDYIESINGKMIRELDFASGISDDTVIAIDENQGLGPAKKLRLKETLKTNFEKFLANIKNLIIKGSITTTKIIIGDGTIEWDPENKGFKVTGGLWTDSYLSTKGANPNTGGNEGGATTLGGLRNVAADADRTYDVAKMLVLEANSNLWTLKNLSELVGGLDEAELAEYLTNNNYAKKSDIPSLDGYATEQWVLGKGYATTSDLDARIDALVNGAPQAYDTLKEIADVLANNINSIDDILTALGTKVSKDDFNTAIANVNNSISALNTELSGKIDLKLDAVTFNELFEKVQLENGTWAIKAKLGLFSDGFISAKGSNLGGTSSEGGAVTLYQLNDVLADGQQVSGAVDGAVFVYDGRLGKWKGIAQSEIVPNLTGYATESWVLQQGFLTEHQDLSGYQPLITATNKLAYSLISGTPDLSVYLTTSSASSTYQPKITSSAKLAASLVSGLATVATSGSYNDLSNKPTIPTSLKNPYALSWSGYSSGSYDGSAAKSITIPSNTNQLTNGAGFITSSVSGSINLNGDWENDFGINFNEGGGATYGFSLLYGVDDLFKLVTRANSTTNTTIFSVTRGSSVLNFANTPTVNGSSVWHAGNFTPSNYLPLSGGTLTGTLRVNNIESSDSNGLLSYLPSNWTGVNNTQWGIGTIVNQGVIRSNNTSLLHYRAGSGAYIIWDSGNDGSGSGLDADLLDGAQGGDYLRKAYDNDSKHSISIWDLNATAGSTSNWTNPANTDLKLIANNNAMVFTVSHVTNQRQAFIQVGHADATYGNALGALFLNKFGGDVYIGGTLAATINSNVASATKLQTARTIWGQSFDGTGNVDGVLYMTNSGATATKAGVLGFDSNTLYVGYSNVLFDVALNGYNNVFLQTRSTIGLTLNSSGNVGIGTSSPQYKLDVVGTVRFSSKSSSVNSFIYINRKSSDGGFLFQYNGTNKWQLSNANKGLIFYNYERGKYDLTLGTDGVITCDGTIYATTGIYSDGYVSALGQNTSSDIRLKNVIEDTNLSISDIAKAPSFKFAWKNGGGVDVGSSAQYWQGLLPDAVKERDGYLEMQYANIALISAIAIARRVETHEERIARLEKENEELRNEISIMKGSNYE